MFPLNRILAKIASASWTPSGRNFTILAMVLGGSSDSPKTGAAAADQAAEKETRKGSNSSSGVV